MWDHEIEPILLGELARAYARRVRWEASVHAGELARVLYGGPEEVSGEQLMATMGAQWQ